MAAETSKHVVLVPMIMWGHTRPMCTLAARLVKLRHVSITMFVSGAFYERAKAEITKDFETGESHLLARITFIPLKQSNSPFDSASYEADFLDTWARFMAGQSLNGYTAAGVPHDVNTSEKDHLAGAIVDMFAIRAFRELHGLKEKLRVKIFSWYPSATSSLFYWFDKDRIPRAEEIAARTGVSFDVAAHEVVTETKGRLVESPCLPPMYDYEYRPQAVCFHFSSLAANFRESDGLITIDAADYHPRTTAAIRSWFAPRPAYYAGPLVSRVPRVLSTDQGAIDAMHFMDERLQSHGAKSVILISFGSMFWPPNTEKVGAVLDVLMDKNIPFVSLARCSPLSAIPEETAGRLVKYDAALVSTWVPQQAVLSHAAMGWCLSHAGHNTVFECIDANVPMHEFTPFSILWPIDADQPPNAIQLADDLGIAYELIEVRNGAGLGPIHRTGRKPDGSIEAVQAEIRDVLGRAFGPDGEEKRMRLDALRTKLRAAWAEGGAARKDMETFLDSL
ncbi:glycosyltransferase family 1 protein [Trametes sanguinea]|nr:glycosyltransferase family 1 protein [Trametes sanguinea]